MEIKHRQAWTEEDINILKINFGKIPTYKLGKILGRTRAATAGRARKLGLFSEYRNRIYSVNNDFFSIPNKLNCYYAGWISSDGSIRKNQLRIELNRRDRVLLENFKKDLNVENPIRDYSRLIYKTDRYMDISSFGIASKQIAQDLAKNFNLHAQKTYRNEPATNLSKYLKLYHLIGMIDGDGSIFYLKKQNVIKISFSSCCVSILLFVQSIFRDVFNVNSTMIKRANRENTYELTCQNKGALKIIYFLRKLNVPKLDRKWSQPILLEKLKEYENYFKTGVITANKANRNKVGYLTKVVSPIFK